MIQPLDNHSGTRTRIGSLFTGYGGLDLAAETVFDAETLWVADTDPAASAVLDHQRPEVPNLGDVTAINWTRPAPVDVLTGGFPCQDISAAGKRAGMKPDTRSGLWTHMVRAIHQLAPTSVIIENVRGILNARAASNVEPCPWCLGNEPDVPVRALGAVLGDLAQLGYDAQWCGLPASEVGTPHVRFRVFLLATANPNRIRPVRGRRPRRRGSGSTDHGVLAAHTPSDGRHEGWAEPSGQFGRPDVAERGRATADSDQSGREGAEPASGHDLSAWGDYAPAIHRWENILGRPAPVATRPSSRTGNPQLTPVFTEWLMGLPAGYVTNVNGLTRSQQLRLLGNGVVPQQAIAALQRLTAISGPEGATEIPCREHAP